MKRFLFLLALLLAAVLPAAAQQLRLEERVPKIRKSAFHWFGDRRPRRAELVVVEFFDAAHTPIDAELAHLDRLTYGQTSGRIQWVVVTRQTPERISERLAYYLKRNPNLAVLCRGDALFRSCDVEYLPFCLVFDRHRRTVWMGNALDLDGGFLTERINEAKR